MATVAEDFTERVADALEEALPEGQTIITKKGVRKGRGGATATVTKAKAKQDDLPTMEDHQRRIPEIEDLGDAMKEIEDQLDALKSKYKDADDELVASMKRHERTFYHRQTWGKVVLSEPRTRAKVTKETIKPSDSDDADSDSPAED